MVAEGTPRTFRSMWVGRTEESDEHLVVNEIGHVVRARTDFVCKENNHKLGVTEEISHKLRIVKVQRALMLAPTSPWICQECKHA